MNVSFPTTQYQVQAPSQGIRSQVKQDVQDLSSALQSGDLTQAQTSFADLQKLLQSSGAISAASTGSTTAASGANSILSDFQALGQALSSGDLASAQKDFTQLQTDATQQIAAQGGPGQVGVHHHHHHAPPVQGTDADGDTDGSSSTTTTPAATAATAAGATGSLARSVSLTA